MTRSDRQLERALRDGLTVLDPEHPPERNGKGWNARCPLCGEQTLGFGGAQGGLRCLCGCDAVRVVGVIDVDGGLGLDELLDVAPVLARQASPLQSIAASDIVMRSVVWFWRGRLASGKLTVVEGDPDVGKSTFLLDLSARVSTGRPMPDGSPGIGAPAGVLILAASEDGAADTIVPRLAAASADLARVRILPLVTLADGTRRPIELPGDIERIRAEIAAYEVRLIIVDALMGALPENVNAYRDQDIRRALHPLADLAEQTGVAVALNRHFTKASAAKAIDRGMGSRAIGAVARCELAVVRDPADEDPASDRRLLAVVKANSIPDREKGSSVFRILSAEVTSREGEVIESSRIVWQGSDPRRADALLAAAAVGEDERSLVDEVAEVVADLLAGGPRLQKDAEREIRSAIAGVSNATVRRARDKLGVTRKAGTVWQQPNPGPYFWRLPDPDPEAEIAGAQPSVSTRSDGDDEHPLGSPDSMRVYEGSEGVEKGAGAHTHVLEHPPPSETVSDDRLEEWNRAAALDVDEDPPA